MAKVVYNSVLGPSIKIDGNRILGLKPFSSKIWLNGINPILQSEEENVTKECYYSLQFLTGSFHSFFENTHSKSLLLPSVSTIFFIHSLKIHIQKSYYCRQLKTDGFYIADYKTLVSFECISFSCFL